MDKNIYVLDMPDFKPVYSQNVQYGYYGKRGDRLKVECVPNMSIVCSNCNQSLKRVGEKKRKEKIKPYMKTYEKNVECQGMDCKAICGPYLALRRQYCKLNQLHLQPYGIEGENSGQEYRLQYDIMNAEFIPSKKYAYDDSDRKILEHHIRQFKLNDIHYKTEALLKFVEDTIEAEGKYNKHKNRYSNCIVDLFVEKIKGYSTEDVLKICENMYINYQLRHIIRNHGF